METMLSGFTEGATQVGSYLEKETEKDVLKKAYAGTEKEAVSPEGVKQPVDMFKVNKLAAQMAAQRGEASIAERFEKRADEGKKSEIGNELKQIELNQSRLEALEQGINSLDNAKDAKTAVVNSQLPTQQKLAIIAQLDQAGDDPEKFKALKDKFQQSVMSAKDRLTAEQRTLQMKQRHEEKLGDQAIKLESVRSNARLRERDLDRKDRAQDWKEQMDEDKLDLNRVKAANQVDAEVDKMISKATRGKDPNEAKLIEKRYRKLAEKRKEDLKKGRKPGATAEPKEAPDIPQDALDTLYANPGAAKYFPKKYGGEAAAKELLARAKQEGKIK